MHAIGIGGKDIHQTGVTTREYELPIDARSNAIVDTGYFIRFARRRWSEGLEPGTVTEW